ncbi:hypothetical protein E2C01_077987 [Portunus trituberculatus]|uniref:Uncharacterized protein n=1 Tax=Portunus trituberculatus TaxID=210409 RepID=A0A5B7IFU1_PORTR|nr:hypothetical protein [Portunus trituberculatus]
MSGLLDTGRYSDPLAEIGRKGEGIQIPRRPRDTQT